jgi:magnesium transporter
MSIPPERVHEEGILEVVSSSLIDSVSTAIYHHDKGKLIELTENLEAADLAELIENLSSEERAAFVQDIKAHFDFKCLADLSDHVLQEVVNYLGVHEVAKNLAELDSDDAFNIIEDLPATQQAELLTALTPQDRANYARFQSYPESSAARLMQHEVVTVPSFWKVAEVVDYIKRAPKMPEDFYEIYVVNPKHTPVGRLALSHLLRENEHTPIKDIMDDDIKSIPLTMDQEEVAHLFRHYDLFSAPVVDESGRMVGMITSDDVVDVIDEEAERDIFQLAGVGESDFHAPVWVTSYRRLAWLLVTFVNALMAAFVIENFKTTIENRSSLAALMIIVAAMGGASGTQVVAVTVRSFAMRLFKSEDPGPVIFKEAMVGLLNAMFFSLILVIIVLFWFNDTTVALILPAAVIFNMCWASLAGVLMPLMVHRMGLDPAVSAGPLVNAMTDILGFATFLGLAKFFL